MQGMRVGDSSEWNVIHYANNAMLTDGSCAPPWGPGWARPSLRDRRGFGRGGWVFTESP